MTPLKGWATTFFIGGMVSLMIAIFLGYNAIDHWTQAERIAKEIQSEPVLIPSPLVIAARALPVSEAKKRAQLSGSVALIAGILALWAFVSGVNLNRADTLLGETFSKCPFCFSTNLVFDAKIGRLDDQVLCRDCQAQWRFHLNPLTSSLTRSLQALLAFG